jgi:hypothetical protein
MILLKKKEICIDISAWNLALQYEDEPLQMKELYTLCSQVI